LTLIQQEPRFAAANQSNVRRPKSSPPLDVRRPPEPLRPEPARRAGFTILAARARRMRYRRRTR
jgi:hypothetical protein